MGALAATLFNVRMSRTRLAFLLVAYCLVYVPIIGAWGEDIQSELNVAQSGIALAGLKLLLLIPPVVGTIYRLHDIGWTGLFSAGIVVYWLGLEELYSGPTLSALILYALPFVYLLHRESDPVTNAWGPPPGDPRD